MNFLTQIIRKWSSRQIPSKSWIIFLFGLCAVVVPVKNEEIYNICGNITEAHANVSLSGTIQSPNYPSDYTRSEECSFTIKAFKEQKILITITDFETENPSIDGTCHDYLKIGPPEAITDTNVDILCGSQGVGFNKTSVVHEVLLQFISDSSRGRKGFSLNFNIIGCSVQQFVVPDYSQIKASTDTRIEVSCLSGYEFDVEGAESVFYTCEGNTWKSIGTGVCVAPQTTSESTTEAPTTSSTVPTVKTTEQSQSQVIITAVCVSVGLVIIIIGIIVSIGIIRKNPPKKITDEEPNLADEEEDLRLDYGYFESADGRVNPVVYPVPVPVEKETIKENPPPDDLPNTAFQGPRKSTKSRKAPRRPAPMAPLPDMDENGAEVVPSEHSDNESELSETESEASEPKSPPPSESPPPLSDTDPTEEPLEDPATPPTPPPLPPEPSPPPSPTPELIESPPQSPTVTPPPVFIPKPKVLKPSIKDKVSVWENIFSGQ